MYECLFNILITKQKKKKKEIQVISLSKISKQGRKNELGL